MFTLPLALSCALALAASDGNDAKKHPAGPAEPTVQRSVPMGSAVVTHPAQPVAPPKPVTPTEPRAPEPREKHGPRFNGAWVPVRVTSGIDELQTRGPGALTPVESPDRVDDAITGAWRLVLPVVTALEDGYGRVDTFRESSELGRLSIDAGGTFRWAIPGRTQTSGSLTEVNESDAPSDEHFWAFEGNGLTLVIAPGSDGSLVLYDASSNAFYARAVRD